MKLVIKLEKGEPVIFWTDCPDVKPGRVMIYARSDQHNEACRAYMRNLPAPKSEADYKKALALLAHWASLPG